MEKQDSRLPRGNNELIARRLFEGRQMVMATMHGKEQVIAPILESALGVSVIVPDGFDTDMFGTFSGEISRKLSPFQAALQKCKAACDFTGHDLAIASEGSFGPHPTIGFVAADEEILVLLDVKNNLEIRSKVVSTQTNFSGALFYDEKEALAFAQNAMFPSHALILKRDKDDYSEIIKGINNPSELASKLAHFLTSFGQVYLETDMRAMHNPSRMEVIREAAKELLINIHSICPNCCSPGFVISRSIPGLPCSWCGNPTPSTMAYIRSCRHCDYQIQEPLHDGKQQEDPMFCPFCNP